MTTLPELIKRLEESTGPSKELDAEIFVLVSGAAAYGVTGVRMGAPGYTRSIDDALTLVPENASSWDCGQIDKDFLASVEFAVDVDGFHNFHAKSSVNAATALTIAALRSRSPQDGEK